MQAGILSIMLTDIVKVICGDTQCHLGLLFKYIRCSHQHTADQ